MIEVDYELGKRLAEDCICGECGGGLTLAWGGAFSRNCYVLRCRNDTSHDTIARRARLSPYDIPGFNLFNLTRRRKEEMVKDLGEEKAARLIKYEGVVSLTKVQAMEILKTIWPKAPEIEVLKAAMVCHQYGLNPLMKHLFLIPFKRKEKGVVVGEDWVTVLGIKSNRLIAQRRHHYSYLDLTPRIMTDEEQEKILGEVDDSRIWAISKIKDMGTGAESMGVGSWPKDEVPYGSDKGNSKLNMACIRSERQALDRQYPGEMPQGVAVIDEEYISGEITEGEVVTPIDESKVSEAEGKLDAPAPKQVDTTAKKNEVAANFQEAETTSTPVRASAADITEDDVPDFNALFKVCFQLWGWQPARVTKELNFSSPFELEQKSDRTPWESFKYLKSFMTEQKEFQ